MMICYLNLFDINMTPTNGILYKHLTFGLISAMILGLRLERVDYGQRQKLLRRQKNPVGYGIEWSQEAPFECSVQGSSCFPKLNAHFCLALTVLKDAFPAMASRQETR